MKKMCFVLIALLTFILAGCTEERLAPDVFLKESWTSTYQMDSKQLGQSYNFDLTLALDPAERQHLLETLPYDSPLRQMPFGVFLQTDLKATMTGDFVLNRQPLQYGGKMIAKLDLGMMTQEFPTELFMDLTGPEGGMFITLGSIWQILTPYSIYQASLNSMNISDPAASLNWDTYLKSLPEDQQRLMESITATFFKYLTITKDESADGLRTIEGDLQLTALLEEFIHNNLDNEEFWQNDQFFATIGQAEREKLQQDWSANKDLVLEQMHTYTQGVQISIRWVADEKSKEQRAMDITLQVGKDAQMMQELSALVQFDQPIHPTLAIEMHTELSEITTPRTVRPESFTMEQQQYLVEQDRQERLKMVDDIFKPLQESFDSYYQLNQKLPTTLTELVDTSYYTLMTIDPFTMQELIYQVTDHQYKVISVGPDGKINTDDDIVLTGTME